MARERFFMMSVAAVLGLLALIAAVHNHDAYYRLPKARFIESLGGRIAARLAYALLGLVLIGLSVAIFRGR